MTAARAICLLTSGDDGATLRWYADADAVERREELASASWQHLLLRGTAPAHVKDAAMAAHRELTANPVADVRHYVTHQLVDGRLMPTGGDAW